MRFLLPLFFPLLFAVSVWGEACLFNLRSSQSFLPVANGFFSAGENPDSFYTVQFRLNASEAEQNGIYCLGARTRNGWQCLGDLKNRATGNLRFVAVDERLYTFFQFSAAGEIDFSLGLDPAWLVGSTLRLSLLEVSGTEPRPTCAPVATTALQPFSVRYALIPATYETPARGHGVTTRLRIVNPQQAPVTVTDRGGLSLAASSDAEITVLLPLDQGRATFCIALDKTPASLLQEGTDRFCKTLSLSDFSLAKVPQ